MYMHASRGIYICSLRQCKCILRYRFHMTPVPVLMLVYTIEYAKEIQASCFSNRQTIHYNGGVMLDETRAIHALW